MSQKWRGSSQIAISKMQEYQEWTCNSAKTPRRLAWELVLFQYQSKTNFGCHSWLSADWAALKQELGSWVILRWQKRWKRQPKRSSWRRPSSQCDSMLKVWSWATSEASRTATATAPYWRLMVSAQRTTRSITWARKLHMSTRPRKRSTIPSSEWCGARFVVPMVTLVWWEPSSARAFLPRPSGLLAVWCSTPAPSEMFGKSASLWASGKIMLALLSNGKLESWQPSVCGRWVICSCRIHTKSNFLSKVEPQFYFFMLLRLLPKPSIKRYKIEQIPFKYINTRHDTFPVSFANLRLGSRGAGPKGPCWRWGAHEWKISGLSWLTHKFWDNFKDEILRIFWLVPFFFPPEPAVRFHRRVGSGLQVRSVPQVCW